MALCLGGRKMKLRLSSKKTIHFLGIGGSGMSPIAHYLLDKGWKVSGTDVTPSEITHSLEKKGATLFYEHSISNLDDVQLIVKSSAIKEDNIELKYAEKQGLIILKRAEMLDYLMGYVSEKIAVAGTHGKTTTSAMVATMLSYSQKDPHFIIGSTLTEFEASFRVGNSNYFVAEADESDGSFLSLHPNWGIITNIEEEHMAYFNSEARLLDHFRRFIEGICNRNGEVMINGDDPKLRELKTTFKKNSIYTYGLDKKNDLCAKNIQYAAEGISFDCFQQDGHSFPVSLPAFGLHNVYNALATVSLGKSLGLKITDIQAGLTAFQGTSRRLQKIGCINNIHIFDDYGHHPTEISTTLSGLKNSLKNRLICVFQPHRYTRTRDLLGDFASAFSLSDIVVITDIYAAGEEKISGITGDVLAHLVKSRHGKEVMFIADKSDVPSYLKNILKPKDVVVTMGAGDIHNVSKQLVQVLEEKR